MLRATAQWILMLLGGVGIVISAVVWYVWARGDEHARQELHSRLAKIAPNCQFDIGKVRFDWDRSLNVNELTMRAAGRAEDSALVVPEAVISLNRERFLNEQIVDVQLIRLIRPELNITRRMDGSWTIEELGPFRFDPKMPLPEWRIENGTLRIRLEQATGEPFVLTLREASLRLVPSGRRGFAIEGLGSVADAGPVQVVGNIDLETKTWSISGAVNSLRTSGRLVDFLLHSSDKVRSKVASIGEQLRDAETRLLPGNHDPRVTMNAVPVRTASVDVEADAGDVVSNGAVASTAEAPDDFGGLGLDARFDVRFKVARANATGPATFQTWVECTDGQIENPLLPFPLKHLRGSIYCDNSMLRLTSLQASGGRTSLTVDGGFELNGPTTTGSVTVSVTDLVLTSRDTDRLGGGFGKLVDALQPSGPIDVSGTFNRNADGSWSSRDFVLTAKGAAIEPKPFPYPIRDVKGTIRQVEPGKLVADMTAMGSASPLRLTGHILNPGPEVEVDLRIAADRVVLDEALREACTPEVQAVLERIGIEAIGDALEVGLTRSPGLDQDLVWWFAAHVINGELEYVEFPYRLTKLTGNIAYHSERETFSFWDVVGRHGETVVTGRGAYRKPPDLREDGTSPIGGGRPGFNLTLNASGVALDGDLQSALPPAVKQLWNELRPGGIADVDATVNCLPGGEPEIELTKIDISRGSLNARCFPYVIDTVAAKARFIPSRFEIIQGRRRKSPAVVAIDEFVGWHAGGVRVAAPSSTLTLSPNGEWLLELPQLNVEDIEFESDFRRAAPQGLRAALEAIDLRGRFEVAGRLALRGTRSVNSTPAAEWNLAIRTLSEAAANAGLELTNVLGEVRCAGRSEEALSLQAQIALRQADVLGQRLERIRGPLRLQGDRLLIGSADAIKVGPPDDGPSVPLERRLCADYLGGLLTLDSEVLLGQGPRYVGRAELTAGSLERYARTSSGTQARDLAGVMNGWLGFWGRGASSAALNGRGQLDISPAALYELPVVMKMFNALFLAPPDGPAFRSAALTFAIRNRMFVFDPTAASEHRGSIVLTGDTLRLVGGGTVDFDQNLNLDFYSALPPNSVRAVERVPVLGQVVGGIVQAATTGWASVVVRGPARDPFVTTVPLKGIPDTFQQMFEALGPMRMPPRTASGASR